MEKGTHVLVTTEYRGVFGGYFEKLSDDGKVITLKNARNCVHWPRELKGFLGLASSGPNEECRIGPRADIALYGVTSIAETTPEAQKNWEKDLWSS